MIAATLLIFAGISAITMTRALAAFIGVDYRISFSAQCWHWEKRGKWRGIVLRPVVDAIFFWDPDHCRRAFDNDTAFNQ